MSEIRLGLQRSLVVLSMVVVVGSVRGLDVESINISHGKDHYDNVPLDQSIWQLPPWGMTIKIRGQGITRVRVTKPGGGVVLPEDEGGGHWEFEDWDFATRTALLSSYPMGTYTFSFNVGEDTVSILHQENEPAGFAHITVPSPSAKGVSYISPTFSWASCDGLGEALSVYIKNEDTGDRPFADWYGDIARVAWQIDGNLSSNTLYYLGTGVTNYTEGNLSTENGDSFHSLREFYYFNHVNFTTAPIDVTRPVIQVNPHEVDLPLFGDAPDVMAGVTATDNMSGNITEDVVASGAEAIDMSQEGTYLVTYDVSDQATNPAGQETREYKVMALDTDDDGMPDWWEDQYGDGSLEPTGDGDEDEIPNLVEFQEGLDPTSPDAVDYLILRSGWNLVAVPVTGRQQTFGDFFEGQAVGVIWAWAGDPKRYEDAGDDEIDAKRGVWVYVTEMCGIPLQ